MDIQHSHNVEHTHCTFIKHKERSEVMSRKTNTCTLNIHRYQSGVDSSTRRESRSIGGGEGTLWKRVGEMEKKDMLLEQASCRVILKCVEEVTCAISDHS